MTTVSKVLEIAKNEVGYCRYDDPERGTKYGRWYADLVGDKAFGANGVAYCAMFASWVLAKAGVECDGMPGAYCPSIHHSQTLRAADLKAGDLVLCDWEDDGTDDHIGIVASNDKAAKTVKTIEGNTSAGSSGSQANGGGVFRRTRNKSLVRAYIRPFGEEMEEDMDIDKLLSEMTDEQAYRLMAKAQAHAASLPEQEWSIKEGHWARATAAGIVNGAAPEGLVKRCEIAAILGRKGLL